MKSRIKFIIVSSVILLLGVSLSGYRVVREKALIIKDVDRDVVTRISVPDRVFTLSFVHSVQHTPVHEIIGIGDGNQLVLKETRYKSLGIGLPYTEENGKFENIGGEFVLKFTREFDSIHIRVSAIPMHQISIADRTYPLLEFAEPENLIEIRAIDRWSFKRVKTW